MGDFDARIAVDWHRSLEKILQQAASLGSKAVLAFDLDSTLFDNRPRQARIVREYGAARGIDGLTRCQPFHFTSGWDLRAAMRACGMNEGDITAKYDDIKSFWAHRFFTSEYAADDIEIVGAPRFVHAVVKTGARVVYLTGRHEEMRAGTVKALAKCGLPVPEGQVSLVMKPTLKESDDAFKRTAHQNLKTLGEIIAAFDNEPTHANDYAAEFPRATVIHLATDHSGRPVPLDARTISVPHFAW